MIAVQPIAIFMLVAIETVRFAIWSLSRLGVWMDRIYDRRRAVEAERVASAKTERARLTKIGTAFKWGLLRQAGFTGRNSSATSDGEVA